MTENDTVGTFGAYGDSKLANVFHMRHLAKMEPAGHFYSLHPGIVDTNLTASWRVNIHNKRLIKKVLHLLWGLLDM